MKRNQISAVILGSFMFLSFGCSSVRVIHTEQVDDFSLSDYSTYDFYDLEVDGEVTTHFNQRIEWLEEALDNQLETRGLKHVEENPDLLINIGIALMEKTQTRETDIRTDAPKYIGSMNYTWQSEEVEVGKYQEGTVVFHFVNSESKILLWEGILQSIVAKTDKAAKKDIDSGVKKMFKDID